MLFRVPVGWLALHASSGQVATGLAKVLLLLLLSLPVPQTVGMRCW